MKDLHSSLGPVLAIGPITISADNTPAAIDLADFQSAVILLCIGIGGITFDATNKIEFKLTHCDEVAGTYEAVEQRHVRGVAAVGTGGIVKSLIAAHAAASVTKIGYVGGKRFLKLLADFSGTHGAGTPMAVLVVKSDPLMAPVA